MGYTTSSNGRVLRTGGPDRAERTVLCLPGGLCTAAFFDDLFAEPAIAAGDVRLVATTVPGFGGVPPPSGFDATVEAHAQLAARLARELGCHAVLGHSFGANIALEMAAGGDFDGRVILLSPSFSREDESKALAMINRIGYVRAFAPSSTRSCSAASRSCSRAACRQRGSTRSPRRWRAPLGRTSR